MSTAYGYYCVPCESYSPKKVSGLDQLQILYGVRSQVRVIFDEFARMDRQLADQPIDITYTCNLDYAEGEIGLWLAKHYNHELVYMDEYGNQWKPGEKPV